MTFSTLSMWKSSNEDWLKGEGETVVWSWKEIVSILELRFQVRSAHPLDAKMAGRMEDENNASEKGRTAEYR